MSNHDAYNTYTVKVSLDQVASWEFLTASVFRTTFPSTNTSTYGEGFFVTQTGSTVAFRTVFTKKIRYICNFR